MRSLPMLDLSCHNARVLGKCKFIDDLCATHALAWYEWNKASGDHRIQSLSATD